MHQDFPGKETHWRHVFFISIAKWSVKEDEKLMSKVAKGKEKMEKLQCAKEQDKESTYSLKIEIGGKCFVYKCFCIRDGACIKKGKPRF